MSPRQESLLTWVLLALCLLLAAWQLRARLLVQHTPLEVLTPDISRRRGRSGAA